MIIKALVENTSVSEEYGREHGLSFYIEIKKHKILFDMGQSDLFIQNAQKMNIDLSEIDLAVISHGHFDHGGGLNHFLSINSKAKIYMHEKAFEKHYSIRPNDYEFIGLDQSLMDHDRIVFVGDYLQIDDELELFSSVTERELFSQSNQSLLMENGNDLAEDTFAHEQNLIITEDGKTLLIAGCAHNGIVNIINRFKQMKGRVSDIVIGGFHLCNPSTGQSEDMLLIREIAERFRATDSIYYTCHCTGLEVFKQLKNLLGNQMRYLATGDVLKI